MGDVYFLAKEKLETLMARLVERGLVYIPVLEE